METYEGVVLSDAQIDLDGFATVANLMCLNLWFNYNAGAGEQVAFDIFRFDSNGKIVEHWDNLATKAVPNPSGHTQVDGYNKLEDLDKTEANRELVKNFLHDVRQKKSTRKNDYMF